MSTTVERNSESPWRKHSLEEDINFEKFKGPRTYFRLASESSKGSEDDTESIYSIQDKETDVVRDSSDTESKSDSDNYEVEIEYEVASMSESDDGISGSSSDPSDFVFAAAAAVMCQSDLEVYVTDCEDSTEENSSGETSFGRLDFSKCVQCQGENHNHEYRYCEKCFQARKKFYPPRPRRRNRRKRANIKLSTLQNCLSGMSQSSGVGSQKDCPELNLDSIYVPTDSRNEKGNSKNEDKSCSSSQSLGVIEKIGSSNSDVLSKSNRSVKSLKRRVSESDDSEVETKKIKIETESSGLESNVESSSRLGDEKSNLLPGPSVDKWCSSISSATSSFSSESSGFSSGSSQERVSEPESALCIFCHSAPKDSIFLHTNIAHHCCCYKCAKFILRTRKRCPICNVAVNKVVKIFSS
ncbi:uncharacterized protein LOC143192005 isoform X2 [Rhynchophorus ferrugineus]|uniref:uncharacterized protein LOC143192005 isoform X2 n=1 Tax=Rhynchophorus ferrugineus TaxID=354439 RepID=UPI003FCD9024